MPRLTCIFVLVFFTFAAVTANAQTREDKKGWHKQGGNAFGIEKGKDGSTEVEFKMDMKFDTKIIRKVSKNSQTCAQKAANPKPGDISFCKAALEEADLSPENRYSATYNMGLMHTHFGEIDLAETQLIAAMALSPEMHDSYLALAKLEAGRGNDVAAMDYATTALSKNPKRPAQTYITIGHLHERDFAFDKAREAYTLAVASNGGHGEARRRLERVNRLWPAK